MHPYLMQTLSADRIRDWHKRAEQARWIKEARHGRPARHARPARELVAAALGPLGIRRVPPARPHGRPDRHRRKAVGRGRRAPVGGHPVT